ncbi:hypothetical protein EZS27_023880 [termite gut metagenome]|uniref:Uncharacterized protein n=1 Tax=termite gut metagenome TaxID=433724 RepID=A0A5J4R069_9ZZZZ
MFLLLFLERKIKVLFQCPPEPEGSFISVKVG